jgi:hypothetical protein
MDKIKDIQYSMELRKLIPFEQNTLLKFALLAAIVTYAYVDFGRLDRIISTDAAKIVLVIGVILLTQIDVTSAILVVMLLLVVVLKDRGGRPQAAARVPEVHAAADAAAAPMEEAKVPSIENMTTHGKQHPSPPDDIFAYSRENDEALSKIMHVPSDRLESIQSNILDATISEPEIEAGNYMLWNTKEDTDA